MNSTPTHIFPTCYLSGAFVPQAEANLSIASSAVLYGLSVYTVFPLCRTQEGTIVAFRLADHYQRLVNSAHIIGLDGFSTQYPYAKFVDIMQKLVSQNNITGDALVRVTFHGTANLPGCKSRGIQTGLSVFIYTAPPIVPQDKTRLKTSLWRRIPDFSIPSRAKVNGAYVNSVLAKQDALDSGYDDALFLDQQGHVCEASAANICMIKDGQLITPSTSQDILEGINRATVLTLAAEMGIPTAERPIDLTELYVADEVFLCGTSSLIAAVVEIDARQVGDGTVGPCTQKIRKAHAAALHGEHTKKAWTTTLSAPQQQKATA